MNADAKSSRKFYSAPKLVRYGDMAKLTASGSAGVNETNPSGQGGKKIV